MIDLNQVALAIAVAEAGSFSAAARALGLPKATVSRQVAQLESSLGALLFTRTTRRLEITRLGLIFFETASPGLEQLALAQQRVTAAKTNPVGRVRVAAPIEFGNRSLGRWITEFLAIYEDVEIELILNERVTDLAGQRIDVAFQPELPDNRDLIVRKLWRSPKVFLASPDYLYRCPAPNSVTELHRHTFIIQGNSLDKVEIAVTGPSETRTMLLKGRFAVDSLQAAFSASVLGLGIVIAPAALAREHIAARRLVRILPQHECGLGIMYAVHGGAPQMTAAARAFLDFVLKAVPRLARETAQFQAGAPD
ncbi:LysR family transcriptional regulator [Mesorhizobium sp. dw_380]|uniref:LysR family transcriptional regulator n=1 Tax=Mesorhizobium sp. dw_380 TaxID=2812001 RepID=UPI001BDDE2B9|nr:LysR family transcriptional regulator [Mesorhizobium sp. dw_380]